MGGKFIAIVACGALLIAMSPSGAAAGHAVLAAGVGTATSNNGWVYAFCDATPVTVTYDALSRIVTIDATSTCLLLPNHLDLYYFPNRCTGDVRAAFTCTYTLASGTTSTLSLDADGTVSYTYDHSSGYLEQVTGQLLRV